MFYQIKYTTSQYYSVFSSSIDAVSRLISHLLCCLSPDSLLKLSSQTRFAVENACASSFIYLTFLKVKSLAVNLCK